MLKLVPTAELGECYVTAEIAVANRWGIAIAADSAVTVEHWHNNGSQEKVYNSANKIFTLSKWHPVGVMIFNTTTLGGVPWEVLIKHVRQKLGRQEFGTLQEYADYLFKSLTNDRVVFSEEITRAIVVRNFREIIREIRGTVSSKSDLSHKLDAEIASLEKVDSLSQFDSKTSRELEVVFRGDVDNILFEELTGSYVSGNKRKLKYLLMLHLTRKQPLTGWSGLVVCGYGANDMFPKLIEYTTDIVVEGRIRAWQRDFREINQKKWSFVQPFADTDVIKTILEGINPRYRFKMVQEVIRLVRRLPTEVMAPVTEISDAKKDVYIKAAAQLLITQLIGFFRRLDNYRDDEHISPIESTIEVLPVSELAVIAETLLNASHIHKRVRPEIETVGGPIDVAVISKGDGFVWIKRKHYFDERLNHAYFSKYLDK